MEHLINKKAQHNRQGLFNQMAGRTGVGACGLLFFYCSSLSLVTDTISALRSATRNCTGSRIFASLDAP